MSSDTLNIAAFRKLIEKDKLEKVIAELNLSEFTHDERLIHLSRRYSEYQNLLFSRERNGIPVSTKSLLVELNNIKRDMLRFLVEMEAILLERSPAYLQNQIKAYLDGNLNAFYSLSAVGTRKGKGEGIMLKPDFSIGETSNSHQNLEEYLNEWLLDEDPARNMVLLGEGGIGKSTFLSYYLSTICANIIEKGNEKATYYPVFCSLKNAYSNSDGQIKSYILDTLLKRIGLSDLTVEDLLSRGRILFIFDAFDEMGFVSTQRKRVKAFNELRYLLKTYPGNKILLAGRGSFFRDETERHRTLGQDGINEDSWAYFEEIHLLPLSEESILRYMKLYFGQDEKAQSNFDWIMSKDHEELAALAGHPFFLFLICEAIERIKSEYKSGEGNTKFSLLKYYISRWIKRQSEKETLLILKGKANTEDEGIVEKLVHSFFTSVAINFYQRGKMKNEELKNQFIHLEFSYAQLQEILDCELKNAALNIPSEIERKQLLDELIAGYFLKWSERGYVFIHDFFLYYYIGDKILDTIKKKEIKNPIYEKMEWNEATFSMIGSILKNMEELKGLPQPTLLSLARGRKRSVFRNMIFRKIGYLLMLLARFAVVVLANSLVILLACFAFALYHKVAGNDGYFALGITLFSLLLGIALFITTKKQHFWNKIFRFLAKEKRNDFSLLVKAYKLAFYNGEFDKHKDLDLYTNLVCTYTIFPTISDVIFDKTAIFKHNLIDITFKNFKHENGSFFVGHAYDCIYENVSFSNTSFYLISFVGCQFRNVDFSEMNYSASWFTQLAVIRRLSRIVGFTKKSHNPGMYLMEFVEISELDFDQKSLESLKEFIHKHGLTLGRHICGPDWLLEKLSDSGDV